MLLICLIEFVTQDKHFQTNWSHAIVGEIDCEYNPCAPLEPQGNATSQTLSAFGQQQMTVRQHEHPVVCLAQASVV